MRQRQEPVFVRMISVSIAVILWASSAIAALPPEEKCEQDKHKAAKTRAICVAKEQFKEAKGKPFDFDKCETKFDADIAKADEKAAKKGASCQYVDNEDGTITNLVDGCMWEQIVRNFSRYHKYTLGADLRDTSRRALKLVVRANARREKVPVLLHVSLRRCKEDGPEGLTGIALPAIS